MRVDVAGPNKGGHRILCRDCRFWIAPDFDEWELEHQTRLGSEQYGECPLGRSRNGEPPKGTLAFARDSEAYSAALRTLSDFGCVSFEEKT